MPCLLNTPAKSLRLSTRILFSHFAYMLFPRGGGGGVADTKTKKKKKSIHESDFLSRSWLLGMFQTSSTRALRLAAVALQTIAPFG